MRRLVLASTLLLAACATRPEVQPEPVQQQLPQAPASPQARQLFGLTPQELVGHLGNPAFQVREGNSLKLQFRGRQCVLDAYLYPQAGGTYRVTWVDTRSRSGVDTDQAACIASLE